MKWCDEDNENAPPLDDWDDKDIPHKKAKKKKEYSVEYRYVGTSNWMKYWKKYETEKAANDAVITLNKQQEGDCFIRAKKQYRVSK